MSYIVGLEEDDRKGKFDNFRIGDTFPHLEWKDRFKIVHTFLERNKIKLGLDEKNEAFKSWIDADYWLYGLLYCVVFKGLVINKEDDLITAVTNEIIEKKNRTSDDYSKNPNRVGNLRDRILRSIKLYEDYAEEPSR